MLQCFGKSNAFSKKEKALIGRIAKAQQPLAVHVKDLYDAGDEVLPSTKTSEFLSARSTFIDLLKETMVVLNIAPASRTYREREHSGDFHTSHELYKPVIFDFGMDSGNQIWMNGVPFDIGTAALIARSVFQSAWMDLSHLLAKWQCAEQSAGWSSSGARPKRCDLQQAFAELDATWAEFERKFVPELQSCADNARRPLLDAAECERELAQLERQLLDHPSHTLSYLRLNLLCKAKRRHLVAYIARLIREADMGFRWNGWSRRSDVLDIQSDVLEQAVDLLKGWTNHSGECSAACIFATDIVMCFDALRVYLQDVANCRGNVDPHLHRNAFLVGHLQSIEKAWLAWEPKTLDALCSVVLKLKKAAQIAPELAEMCDNFDAQVFMILPRMFWLCFLDEPSRQSALLRGLLPERFCPSDVECGSQSEIRTCLGLCRHTVSGLREVSSAEPPVLDAQGQESGVSGLRCPVSGLRRVAAIRCSERSVTWVHSPPRGADAKTLSNWNETLQDFNLLRECDVELQALVEMLWSLERMFDDQGRGDLDEVLLKMAVSGPGKVEEVKGVTPLAADLCSTIQSFMLKLEQWSIELQRNCPEAWNNCSAILMQSLSWGSSNGAQQQLLRTSAQV